VISLRAITIAWKTFIQPPNYLANHGEGRADDGIARRARGRRERRRPPPPVHLWNPPFCGDLDMRIAADGTWYYLKTPIGRPALVKLFASYLSAK